MGRESIRSIGSRRPSGCHLSSPPSSFPFPASDSSSLPSSMLGSQVISVCVCACVYEPETVLFVGTAETKKPQQHEGTYEAQDVLNHELSLCLSSLQVQLLRASKLG